MRYIGRYVDALWNPVTQMFTLVLSDLDTDSPDAGMVFTSFPPLSVHHSDQVSGLSNEVVMVTFSPIFRKHRASYFGSNRILRLSVVGFYNED